LERAAIHVLVRHLDRHGQLEQDAKGTRMNWQRIRSLLVKEALQLKRDKQILRIVFIAPIVQLFVFGLAINLDVVDIPTVICDLDRSEQSRAFVDRFSHSGYFPVVSYVDRLRDEDRYIESGEATLALNIPRGFSERISRGDPVAVQTIVDGSESNAATVGIAYAAMIAGQYSQQILLDKFSRMGAGQLIRGGIVPQIRVWYNPSLQSRRYLVPGILGLLLMTATAMLTSLGIVKERERGTMEQLVVTPIRPIEIILGKLAPFMVIGIIDIILVLLGTTLVLGIPIRGSIVLLFLLSILFIMTTLGIGLFVSTISRTQQQAMMTAMFFVLLPMNFLSGFIFPIENMPTAIQAVTYLMPLRYFFEIIRGIFLRGAGLEVLWPQALALLAFGIAILTLAGLRFRKRLT
jgi:ABC-2 type transport system permease protein